MTPPRDDNSVLISFQNILKLTEPGSDAIGNLERAIGVIHEVIFPLVAGGVISDGLNVKPCCSHSDSGQLRPSGEENETDRGADLPGRSDRFWPN